MAVNSRKTFEFASKTVAVNFDNSLSSNILKNELSLYKSSTLDPDFIVNINDESGNSNVIAQNPSTHKELENGFACSFGKREISWTMEHEKLSARLYMNGNDEKNWLRKIRNIQYSHPYEEIGQVFHELVLIPTLFFFSDDLTLIHGSAVENRKGRAIIIGGTGGVGKTSLSLSLVLDKGYKFLADDISILDRKGDVLPNFAFPKIYAYNTIDNPELEKKLLNGRSILDKVQWYFIKKRNPSRVRRRVNPAVFYNGNLSWGSRLSKIFILFKGDYRDFSLQNIPCEKVAKINVEIMKSEYWIFLRHLYWHKMNSIVLGRDLFLDLDIVLNNWYSLQMQVFKDAECYLVKVPLQSRAMELQKWFLSVVV